MIREPDISWKDAIKPIRDKFDLAATFHMTASFHDEGAKAGRDLIDFMAERLDTARQRPTIKDAVGSMAAMFLLGLFIGLIIAPYVGGH